MAAFRIRLLPSEEAQVLRLTRGNWYELEDGFRLPVSTQPAWCPQCAAFVEAEFLPSTNPPEDPPLSERRRAWREARHAPPHCLDCGCDSVTVLSVWEETPSPCHNGTIKVEPGVLAPPILLNRIYTPEGARKA